MGFPFKSIETFDNPNEGRGKINYNFSVINEGAYGSTGGFSGWTASTGPYSIIANNGTSNVANGSYSIVSGKQNTASGAYSSILNGLNNAITGNRSTIIGGQNITGTTDDTVYVPGLINTRVASVPSSSYDSIGENGSITWDDTYIYWKSGGQWIRVAGSLFNICLAKGTKILLANNTYKNIENITYNDLIRVWNFDEGTYGESLPLWIKMPETTNEYNLLVFSDGTELKTISQHRIFNIEKGMFTYPMTDDTPIGTSTFNSRGDIVILIKKEIVHDFVDYYNVITDKNLNLFANDILTSCRYNNIYPIVDMKFIKDNRVLRDKKEFMNISDKYYYGLRLNEQTFTLEDIKWYINRLEKFEKNKTLNLV